MYCALSDIVARVPEETIIQLTDDAGLGAVDQTKVDQAISDSGEVIDGFLRGRYDLPLTTVPGLVLKIAVDLAVFNLYLRKMEIEMPKPVSDRYDNSVKLLMQIQKGLISLGIEATAAPAGGNYKTNKASTDRLFGKDTLDEY